MDQYRIVYRVAFTYTVLQAPVNALVRSLKCVTGRQNIAIIANTSYINLYF